MPKGWRDGGMNMVYACIHVIPFRKKKKKKLGLGLGLGLVFDIFFYSLGVLSFSSSASVSSSPSASHHHLGQKDSLDTRYQIPPDTNTRYVSRLAFGVYSVLLGVGGINSVTFY